MSTPDLQPFVDHLEGEAFALGRAVVGTERIGAEVELIPIVGASGGIAPIEGRGEPATLPALRAMARRFGWRESVSAKSGAPEFRAASGGRLCFEPGGQIEYAAPPNESVSDLARELQIVALAIREWLADAGITLVAAGIDPRNRLADVPLQLRGDRYRRMDAHFARIGPHGARMMRQTASIQVSLDAGPEPLARWELPNALAPYLVAIFANSPLYAGADTGHRSIRRQIWGSLDPGRTGIAYHRSDPVGHYARFALGAGAILLGHESQPSRTFAEHARDGAPTIADWREHLSTLFPEVRPRGYFEVRSTDALPPEWYAVPLVFLSGLTRAPAIAARAREIAGEPDATRLARAGRCGLSDAELAAAAGELARLAMEGSERLPREVVSTKDLETAAQFFDRYTHRRRSPSDDALELVPG